MSITGAALPLLRIMYSPLKLQDFQPATDGLAKVIKNLEGKNNKIYFKLMFDWHMIVGDNLAKACSPVKLTGGKKENILYLIAKPEDVTQVSFARDIIIEKISFHFGFKAVNKIKILQNIDD